MWKQLQSAFSVLEKDFKKFDAQGDGLVDYTEITKGIPPVDKDIQLSVLTRLLRAFRMVDLDRNGFLDFHEYMFLGLVLTDEGAYHLLVNSANCSIVKKTFLDIKKFY